MAPFHFLIMVIDGHVRTENATGTGMRALGKERCNLDQAPLEGTTYSDRVLFARQQSGASAVIRSVEGERLLAQEAEVVGSPGDDGFLPLCKLIPALCASYPFPVQAQLYGLDTRMPACCRRVWHRTSRMRGLAVNGDTCYTG